METTKSLRYLDAQGRIVLPSHIRNGLNLNPGNVVSVELEDGSIKIRPTVERCEVCGKSVEQEKCAAIKVDSGTRFVCRKCAYRIVRAFKEADTV